jgi:hypothetical protein
MQCKGDHMKFGFLLEIGAVTKHPPNTPYIAHPSIIGISSMDLRSATRTDIGKDALSNANAFLRSPCVRGIFKQRRRGSVSMVL